MKDWHKLVASIAGCELTGIISSAFTFSAIPDWYAGLNKPPFSPPNRIFGPAWTLLYALMGISFYLIWKRGLKKRAVRAAVKIFLAQLTLNFLWSPVFFGLRSPASGLVVIIMLLIFIMLTIRAFYPLSKLAAYLLIPYFLWVSFATILNASIVILN